MNLSISIDMPDLPSPTIDEDAISNWVYARLNDGRNAFIEQVTPLGGTRSPSRPGEFPVGQTGNLARSIIDPEVDGRSGRIYSDAPYAPYLARKARLMLGAALAQSLGERPQLEVLAGAAKFV